MWYEKVGTSNILLLVKVKNSHAFKYQLGNEFIVTNTDKEVDFVEEPTVLYYH